MKLSTLLDASVRRDPDKEALVYGTERVAYRDLRDRALRAASVLRANGIEAGDTIGIMTFNVPGFVYAAFGAWYLGATVVPVNHKMQPPEVAYTIGHSKAKLGIVSAELAEIARTGAPDIPWLATESEEPESFDAQLAAATPADPAELADFDDEAVAQVLYTSGTTSAPKGCIHPHRNIAQVAMLIALNMGYRADDRFLICMPIWHSAPLNISLMPMMLVGGTVVLQREYHPVESMKILAAERITTFFGPTIAYVAPILTAKKLGIDFSSYDFSTVRRWTYGGAPIDRETAKMLIDTYGTDQFYNLFGMSEMGPTGCLLPPEDQVRKAGSVGRAAMVGNEMRVVKADGTEAGPGETGEIWFSGDCRMRGYLDNPAATEAAFEGDWYRSGDVARIDEDGYLYIVDRMKDVIIVGGENVYSLEVEEAIIAHPDVVDVAVVGRPDPEWGEQVVAVVTTADGAELDVETLRDHLSDKLARYKLPREVIVTEALPRNPSGKLLKHRLRDEVAHPSDA
ncbi:class I adenylate-forming enzyme family protein [Brevibacterium sp. CS2]|uniref:class I adenylate-forming enzyme family protein n=1 Tax=Brevibacterium sp. CS2 TaxID=2575923 RepID=UPI0010C7ACD6|nr:AMP-binding protein [Brevibacterium sp. CS2]QCP05044.1 fatty-acid--CoA ligase [Brevibacterium sp. CS2]